MNFIITFILSGTVFIGGSNAQTVNQTSAPMNVHAGDSVLLECTYKVSVNPYLFWYVQYNGKEPTMLINDLMQTKYKEFSAEHEKSKSSFHLKKEQVDLTDSGVYFCACVNSGNWGKLVFGGGTQLNIIPKTDRDLPSVYQLKSSKTVSGLPDSVCLVTDIPSVEQKLILNETNISSEVVLDKSDTDVWRTSVVIWDYDNPSGTLPCKLHYGNIDVSPDSDTDESQNTCSSLSIDESFRTNPSMNTLSLTVLGLRVLTIKAIVFNVIITLRLWSS
ncbi:T cell receptor alpha chain MC.7.G5-like isoform X2 [Mixophyes fleayi]|uniref:T cell receptor alpha chain MC.7.G5-like isoform X2 n=1 Tax=Mixophyes fleayi TaxID=3061075 RepID=UPI003F4E1ABD